MNQMQTTKQWETLNSTLWPFFSSFTSKLMELKDSGKMNIKSKLKKKFELAKP